MYQRILFGVALLRRNKVDRRKVSEHVLSRIETPAALAGRSALVDYWSENPWVAKKKGINLFVSIKIDFHGSSKN